MRTFVLLGEEQRERAINALHCLNLAAQPPWGVWVAPYEKIRSLEANARYWARLKEISDATGHDTEALHIWLKCKFLGRQYIDIGGEVHEAPAASRKLSVKAFNDYMTQVDAWAAENGIT
jgi:hypothetical protein